MYLRQGNIFQKKQTNTPRPAESVSHGARRRRLPARAFNAPPPEIFIGLAEFDLTQRRIKLRHFLVPQSPHAHLQGGLHVISHVGGTPGL